MPFGLTNAPATFQRLSQQLFGDLRGVIAYIDDLILFSKDMDSHLKLLNEVFTRLHTAGLKVKLVKCHFAKDRIRFLGHQISRKGIETQPDKIQVVSNLPTNNIY